MTMATIGLAVALGVELLNKPESIPNLCQTEGCIQASARILASLDTSVDPCENFYQFSCGNWLKENILPKGDKIFYVASMIYDNLTCEWYIMYTCTDQLDINFSCYSIIVHSYKLFSVPTKTVIIIEFLSSRIIPAVGVGSVTALQQEPLETNNIALRKILEGEGNEELAAVRKAKDLYWSCLDTATINSLGAQPLRDLINDTGIMIYTAHFLKILLQ